MAAQDIAKMLTVGETETVEFKENFDNATIETATAFANTKGGNIFIGISDDGTVKGAQVGKERVKDWANRISQSSEPRVIPEIESIEIDVKRSLLSR